MKRDSLEAVMKQPEEGIAISIGVPGEEVWGFMKSTVAIRFRQKDNWYCVAYSLASALHFIGGCDHIYNEIVKLASVIDGKDYKFQAEMIKNTYNHAFKSDPVYGLGEAVVVTKERKLKKIHNLLLDPTDKLYTIFSKDHCVTLYQNYIFDAFQTHAVFCSQYALNFIFDKDFQLNLAIKYENCS